MQVFKTYLLIILAVLMGVNLMLLLKLLKKNLLGVEVKNILLEIIVKEWLYLVAEILLKY